jgi:hypothetical protein
MKDHTGGVRAFTHRNRSWYAKYLQPHTGAVDEVMFGYYNPEGGTSGEMAMRWYDLGGAPTPRIEVFCDAWHALSTFGNVLAALGELDGSDISPEQFCNVLRALGFEDHTEEVRK